MRKNDMVVYKATSESSASGVYRDETSEFIIDSLNNYTVPSDMILTKEQCVDVKRCLEELYWDDKSEVQIQNMLLDLSSEIGCSKQVVASIIARLWIACHWRWSYLVEKYLTNRNWEMFIYNHGWSNQMGLPRTDSVNDLIHKPITVNFEGFRKSKILGETESYYYEKSIQL